jgi:hypothetical protein
MAKPNYAFAKRQKELEKKRKKEEKKLLKTQAGGAEENSHEVDTEADDEDSDPIDGTQSSDLPQAAAADAHSGSDMVEPAKVPMGDHATNSSK